MADMSREDRIRSLADGIHRQSNELCAILAGVDTHEESTEPAEAQVEGERAFESPFPMEDHGVGFLTIPKNIDALPRLTLAAGQRLVSPAKIDLRSWNLPPKDQLGTPSYCTVSGYALIISSCARLKWLPPTFR